VIISTGHQPAVDRMQHLLQAGQVQRDTRAIFLGCYELMTRNMLAAIEAGEFQDPAWVSAWLDHFADYYFNALDAFDQDLDNLPQPWRYAFSAAREPGTLVLQNLLLGINAHINYDLILALSDMLAPDWSDLPEAKRQARYQDHCTVNALIARTTDEVQDKVVEFYSPIYNLADVLLGPIDEWLVSRLINAWREQVWQMAVQYTETFLPEEREEIRRQIEIKSSEQAHHILVSSLEKLLKFD
jgi:hypothetical protein